jgi:paraquat-inducible protein B
VVAHELDRDGGGVTLKIFVEAPYDRHVNPNTRFWDESGIDIIADASGVKINTLSLVSILLGGIAFETPATSPVALQADEDTIFTLFPDRGQAMKRPDTEVVVFTATFRGSLRGLSVGAPLDFSGVPIGEVKSIGAELDDAAKLIHFPVELALYPERLRSMNRVSLAKPTPAERKARMDGLVEAGLRAQLRTGSLLTGQLFVAFDFFPNAPKAKIDWTKTPPELPTEPSGLQELQIMLASLSRKLEKVPFDKIGADLQQMLQSASSLAKRLDTEVAPEARATLAEARKTLGTAERTLKSDAPLQQDAREALREVGRAAQAMRVLADYLERHPEALIRGKKGDKS